MATYEDNVIPITRNRTIAEPARNGMLAKLVLVAGLALLISEQTRTAGIALVAAGVLLTLAHRRPSAPVAEDLHRVYLPTGQTINIETERP